MIKNLDIKSKVNKLIFDYVVAESDYEYSVSNADTKKKKFILRLPNRLAKIRLASPFVLDMMTSQKIAPSIIVGAVAAFGLTDFVDGKVAKYCNAKSSYGAILDPIADKVFFIGATIPILAFMPSFIIRTIALEGIIGAINLISKAKGNEPKSAIIGKIKTVFAFGSAAVLYYKMLFNLLSFDPTNLFIVTSALQILTAGWYILVDIKKSYKKKKESNLNLKEEIDEEEIDEEEIDMQQTKDLAKTKEIEITPEIKEQIDTIVDTPQQRINDIVDEAKRKSFTL